MDRITHVFPALGISKGEKSVHHLGFFTAKE
jgi:hypothetical protein